MNAPKLWLVQWTGIKEDKQVAVFATKALALAYITDENLRAATPMWHGIFLYQIGTVAAKREWTGTWD
jgi:hypothetical protein